MALPLNLPYDEKYVQFAYSSTDGNPDYAGFANPGSADGDSVWTIKKYTYDGSRQCTKIQIVFKKDWTNRASHF